MNFLSLPDELVIAILKYLLPHERFHWIKTRNSNIIFNEISMACTIMSLNSVMMKSERVMEFLNEFWWNVMMERYCSDGAKKKPFVDSLKILKQEMIKKQCMKRCVNLFVHAYRKLNELPTMNKIIQQEQLVVLGDEGVGKSSIITLFVRGVFQSCFDPMIIESYLKHVCVDGNTVMLEILEDVAWTDSCIRHAKSFILVCAVNNKLNAKNLDNILQHIFELNADPQNCAFIFTMNKIDLVHEAFTDIVKDINEIEKIIFGFINKYQIEHCAIIETSAKNNVNISLVFEECVSMNLSKRNTSRNIELLQKVVKMDKKVLKHLSQNCQTKHCFLQ